VDGPRGRSNAIFVKVFRAPKVTRIEPPVALPGKKVVLTGTNFEPEALAVQVGGAPAEISDATATSVSVVVPDQPVSEGRTVPVILRSGKNAAPAASLVIGRLPLVQQVQPAGSLAGERVTLRGLGFDRAFLDLGMQTVMACTPAGTDVRYVDEHLAPLDYDVPGDVVALSAKTSCVTRVYEVAEEFRRRGRRVILGGIHASLRPDEALRHVDCVVTGEAEVREASGADPVAFERPTYPHGPVLVARRTGSYEGERYPAETSVWAARAGHCCIATIGEFFTDATAEQVDDVARLCDATAPATTVAP
jgi:hypothetical protein